VSQSLSLYECRSLKGIFTSFRCYLKTRMLIRYWSCFIHFKNFIWLLSHCVETNCGVWKQIFRICCPENRYISDVFTNCTYWHLWCLLAAIPLAWQVTIEDVELGTLTCVMWCRCGHASGNHCS